MKKTIKNCYFLLLASCITLVFCGCQTLSNTQNNALRIGVAVYQQDDTFISTIVQNLEKIAREEETTRNIKISFTILDGQSNQTVQLEQVNRMIEQECDILLVNIVDRTSAATLIDNAQAANIPIVFFNRQPVDEDMERWEHAYYVGAQAEQSGRLQGEIVLDLWQTRQSVIDKNGDGVLQYIMLEGEPGHQDTLLRTQYAIQTLTQASLKVEKLASQTANWKRGEAARLTTEYLVQFGDTIEAIFANNDDMALGAIDAYTAQGVSAEDFPVIVGVDATPQAQEAILQGVLQGTVLNDSEGIARAMMQVAIALHYEKTPVSELPLENGHYIWLPYQKITAQTLQ